MTTIPVQIAIPLTDYPALAAIAEGQGYETIAGFLEGLIARIGRLNPGADEVELMVRAGFCDAEIADTMHLTPGHIADRRRALGLKANPRYATRKATR